MAVKTIGGIIGGIGGAIAGNMGRRQQHRNTKELMQIQQDYNKQNMEKAQEQQFEMWQKTNFPAQVEMMKNAGLNVGLMYEGGGAGGTTGAGNMASAGLGAAPNYDIAGDMAKGGAMAREIAQLGLLKAQKENIEADTNQKNTNTDLTGQHVKINEETWNNILEMSLLNVNNRREENKQIRLQNDLEEWLQTAPEGAQSPREREALGNINKIVSEIQKIDEEVKVIGGQLGIQNATISKIMADTKLQNQLHEYLEKANPQQLETILNQLNREKVELERLHNDPNYSPWGTKINYILDKADQVINTVQGAQKINIKPKK